MNVNSVISSIYGAGSPQSFDHISLCGGSKIKLNNNKPNIRYLDEEVMNSEQIHESTPVTMPAITGGYAAKADSKPEDWPVYTNATYVEDPMLELLRKVFCLNWSLCNARYNTIYVIEDEKTVKKYCDEWLKELESKGYMPGTVEASKYTAKSNCRFNKCTFDVFSQNPPNNAGMEYHVDADFPAIIKKDEVIRRTNRDGQVCFFKFNGPDEIICSESPNFPGGSDKTTTLKLLAKCQAAVFIIKGSLPKSITDAGAAANSKSASYTLAGGSRNVVLGHIKNDFIKEFNEAGHDMEEASYNYLGKQVLQSIYNGESEEKAVEKLSKYYSGDHIFSAVKLMSDENSPALPINVEFDEEEIREAHKMLIDKMNCQNSIGKDSIRKFVDSVAARHAKANGSASAFMHSMKGKYKNICDFKADVVTPYLKRHSSIGGINTAFKIMRDMDAALASDSYNDGTCTQVGNTCALNNIVLESITDGLTSVNAKANIPRLLACGKKNKRRVLKRKAMSGGSIYGGDDEVKPVQPVKADDEVVIGDEAETKIEALENSINEVAVSDDENFDDELANDDIISQFKQFTD